MSREPDATPGRLYGRRRGRPLRRHRRDLVATLLPEIAVHLPDAGRLDPAALFEPPVDEIWLEVGFGAGEHLAEQARGNPRIGFIGCEPFINGIAGLLARIAAEGLANVRIYPDDARRLMAALPDASIGRMFVLFPDPWPKARHHKRRFISRATLDGLARVLRDGAELRLATDHAEYCRWMLDCLQRHPAFAWLARGPGDWRERPPDWPATRYEAKARAAEARPVFLRFRRAGRR